MSYVHTQKRKIIRRLKKAHGVADRYYGATHDRGYGASRKRPKTGLYDMAKLVFFTPFRKCRF
jgi:hypothetical protein